MHDAMIRAYFRQVSLYYSESKEAMIPIEDMHPAHAANAVSKLISEADFWAKEAEQATHRNAMLWMISRPLFLALTKRASSHLTD